MNGGDHKHSVHNTHFTSEETEAQRGSVSCRVTQLAVAIFGSRQPDSTVLALPPFLCRLSQGKRLPPALRKKLPDRKSADSGFRGKDRARSAGGARKPGVGQQGEEKSPV